MFKSCYQILQTLMEPKAHDKERKVMNNRLLKKTWKNTKNSLTKINLVGILLLVQKTEGNISSKT